MTAFIIYLLKSTACSGILFIFYRIAYYNKPQHQWSRYYLLASVLLSLILPMIHLEVPVAAGQQASPVMQLLNVVATANTERDEGIATPHGSLNTETLSILIYASISFVSLFLLFKDLMRILMIYITYPKERVNAIEIVMTAEKNSPFSFLRTVFWNKDIDISSRVGKKIFEHEKVHIQQLHTVDRLFISAVLTAFWCNPFFWLIRKELIIVHEFMADKKSVEDRNPETLSEMMLLCAFPGQTFSVTSSFINSSIKRRLTMLTTIHHSRFTLLGRWMLMPVILLLLTAFTLRKSHIVNGPAAPFIVMIDAGHGGERSGAIAPDGTKEKDLNLIIAKKIKSLNRDANIKIVMTRDVDFETPLRDRVTMANDAKADAFISIHINRDPSGGSGFQIYITKNANDYAKKSQLLGSLLTQELKKVYTVDGDLRKGLPDQGIWVLDAPEITYPSLLVECGNLLNDRDLAFVKAGDNQEKIAQQILNAIRLFAENKTAN